MQTELRRGGPLLSRTCGAGAVHWTTGRRRNAMTEAEWLASTDVDMMCGFLHDAAALFRTRRQGYVAGHLARHLAVPRLAFSERKSRLFAVACCRHILHLMPTDEARACVLAAE